VDDVKRGVEEQPAAMIAQSEVVAAANIRNEVLGRCGDGVLRRSKSRTPGSVDKSSPEGPLIPDDKIVSVGPLAQKGTRPMK
jgi:hypothetical protein